MSEMDEIVDNSIETKENVHQSLKLNENKVKRSSILVSKNESLQQETKCSRRSDEMDRLNHLFETLSIRSLSEGREIEEFTSDLIQDEFELRKDMNNEDCNLDNQKIKENVENHEMATKSEETTMKLINYPEEGECNQKIKNLDGTLFINMENKQEESNKTMNLNQTIEIDGKMTKLNETLEINTKNVQDESSQNHDITMKLINYPEEGECNQKIKILDGTLVINVENKQEESNKTMNLNQTIEIDGKMTKLNETLEINTKNVQDESSQNHDITMKLINYPEEGECNQKIKILDGTLVINVENKQEESNKTMNLNQTIEIDGKMTKLNETLEINTKNVQDESSQNHDITMKLINYPEEGECNQKIKILDGTLVINVENKQEESNKTMNLNQTIEIDGKMTKLNETLEINTENIPDELSQNQEIVIKTKEVEEINNLDETLVINNQEILSQSLELVTKPKEIEENTVDLIKNCADEGNLNKSNKTMNLSQTMEIDAENIKENADDFEINTENIPGELSQNQEIVKTEEISMKLNDNTEEEGCNQEIKNLDGTLVINAETIKSKETEESNKSNKTMNLNETIDVDEKNVEEESSQCHKTKEMNCKKNLDETLVINNEEKLSQTPKMVNPNKSDQKLKNLNQTLDMNTECSEEKSSQSQENLIKQEQIEKTTKNLVKCRPPISRKNLIKNLNQTIEIKTGQSHKIDSQKTKLNETFNAENNKDVDKELKKLPKKIKRSDTIVIKPRNDDAGSSKNFGDSVKNVELNETLVIKTDKSEMNETLPIKDIKKKLFRMKKVEMVNSSTQCDQAEGVEIEGSVKNHSKSLKDYEQNLFQQISEVATIKEEFTTKQELLVNLESAFSTAHEKYERCKSVANVYKSNEEALRKSLAEAEEKLKGGMNTERNVKSQIEKCLNEYYGQLMSKRDEYARELRKTAKTVKILEIKVKSLETNLAQKCEERDNLMSVLNDSVRH
nr:TATA element modulatory factor-like [Onthophagus taurus]